MARNAIPRIQIGGVVINYRSPCNCGCGETRVRSARSVRINGRLRVRPNKEASRHIYFVGSRFVVKIGERDQNLQEAKKWAEVKGTVDARFFSEVLAVAEDGSWLVQRRVTFRKSTYEHADLHISHQVEDLAIRHGIGDMHRENWGITPSGEPIIFDLGV